ncbi:MAG: pentapeptide repeat-containing protein [Actinomycetota bacterium]
MASVTSTNATRPRPADLPEVLIGADLRDLDLRGVDFRGAVLDRADLRNAKLNGADLSGASMRDVNLDDAELIGARLDGADLSDANVRRAVLGRASMVDATLFNADLSEASLTDADLTKADLRAATLDEARLLNTTLLDADLTHASLLDADLEGADVTDATLRGANIRGIHLRSVRGFDSADWVEVLIGDTEFEGAHLIRRVILDQNYLHEFRNRDRTHAVIYQVWRVTSDCGRSFGRWGLLTAVFATVFAIAYTQVEIDYGDYETTLSPLYFSVVTLTTLGYGDALPASMPAQILVLIEVIVGYVMLGGVLSIFANRMGRRAD